MLANGDYLGRVPYPEEERRRLDAVSVLRRMRGAGSSWFDFEKAIPLLRLEPRDVDRLDDTLFELWFTLDSHQFARYLVGTHRGGWPGAQAFVERCLTEQPRCRASIIKALRFISQHPPGDYIRGLLDRYDVSEKAEAEIRRLFRLD